jgi:hypothetical protein
LLQLEAPLVFSQAGAARAHSGLRVDPKVLPNEPMAVFTDRLPVEGAVLGVGNDLQMIRVPTGVDSAAVMQLHTVGNGAAE